MTEVVKANAGYSVKTVADRIAAMDIDAQGNAEKAAWKRYAAYAHLALAKGVSKKNMAAAVFGKDAKPSKNFSNMWSLAERSNHNPLLLGNHSWGEIGQLGIDDALDAVIAMINRHMAVLEVGGKNAYDPIAGMSLEAIAAKKANDEAEAAEAAAEAAADAEAKADADAEAEQAARDKADAAAPKTAAEIAKDALHGASLEEMMDVLLHIVGRVDVGTLKAVHRDLGAMIENMEAKADVIDLTATDVTPVKGQKQIGKAKAA